MKQQLTGLLSAILLSLLISTGLAQPVTYYFSGQITGKRVQNSVFSGGIGDQFSGYFSYDPTATTIAPQYFYYPLLQFSIDGNSLINSPGSSIPLVPGIVGMISGPGLPNLMEFRGFYLPAINGNLNDNGSTSLAFADLRGTFLTNYALPTSINLDSFYESSVFGPSFGVSPVPIPDRGIVTALIAVPEPSVVGLLVLALSMVCSTRRRLAGVIP